jgi:hypothetical protein
VPIVEITVPAGSVSPSASVTTRSSMRTARALSRTWIPRIIILRPANSPSDAESSGSSRSWLCSSVTLTSSRRMRG